MVTQTPDLGGTPILWTCETCGMPQRLSDHGANTLCPYGLVAAIEVGYISADEACRRLEAS